MRSRPRGKVASWYAAADGKIRRWFEESYRVLAAKPEFATLSSLPVESVHNGYFARDKEGPTDSREGRPSKADDEAYRLIMREKERLLSPEEPLRFIFSHSALREGWDNPNVFQICTLREGQSEVRKRQEIGRGLRLARMENGFRCDDPRINRLTLIANESFADFARKLQTEFEEECGVSFKDRIVNKRERRKVALRKERYVSEDFRELWERISQKTQYRVDVPTEALVAKAAGALKDEPEVSVPQISVTRSQIMFSEEGVEEAPRSMRNATLADYRPALPDIIGYLQRETELTRSTLVEILVRSGRVQEALKNPQEFMEQAASCIQHAKRELMVDGVKYERVVGHRYEMQLFENEEIESYLSRLLLVQKSIHEAIEWDSEVERGFAEQMEADEDIRLFVKLPRWFKVDTPLGGYNPDWAIVRESDGRVYLVAETKGTTDVKTLASKEALRIKCGRRHFEDCLQVSYKVATTLQDVL